jgi:protein TonB
MIRCTFCVLLVLLSLPLPGWSQDRSPVLPPFPRLDPSPPERPRNYKKPVALNQPTPRYTSEAMINHLQGTVRMKVLVGADGLVKQVRITRGLPDGLDEQAIQTAYRMRFRPAMAGNRTIAAWTTVQIEFRLPKTNTGAKKASRQWV